MGNGDITIKKQNSSIEKTGGKVRKLLYVNLWSCGGYYKKIRT